LKKSVIMYWGYFEYEPIVKCFDLLNAKVRIIYRKLEYIR